MARLEPMKSRTGLPLRSVVKWALAIVSAALILAALGIMLAPHFGWRVDKVMSGSMEPALRVGGLVVMRPVQAEEITNGDVVAYASPMQEDTNICHRVVEVRDTVPPSFITKGDANEEPDRYVVSGTSVKGKVVFHLPLLGYFAAFARSPAGFILLVIVPGLAVIAWEMRDIWIALSEMERKRKEEQTIPEDLF